jgi:hypothetical protein
VKQHDYRQVLALGLVAVAISGCNFLRTHESASLDPNAQLLATNGRAYTGHIHSLLGFKSFRSDADITLCLDHLDLMQEEHTTLGYLWLPALTFTPAQEVRLSHDGTSFVSPDLPLGIYGGARLSLSAACPSGKSLQVANAAGTFSVSDPLQLSFSGMAPVTPLTGSFLFETQTLVNALETVTASAQLNQSLLVFVSGMYSGGLPFGGTAAQLPGIVEAENFDIGGPKVVYGFANSSNGTLLYRPDPYIKIEPCSEGGYDLYGFNQDDFVTYSVDVQADGLYTFAARVSAPNSMGLFKLQLDGADATDWIPVPSTGGTQNWTNVTQPGLFLPAGPHYIRLIAKTANGDMNLETFSLNYFRVY